jgi:hypothetical protein
MDVRAFSISMHFSALLPLVLFGFMSVLAFCMAIRAAAHDVGAALMIAALGLVATLAYPAAIDAEAWLEKNMSSNRDDPLPRIPMAVHDVLFLGGGLVASWWLASEIKPLESIGIAIVVWIVAGSAARRRAAERDAPLSKRGS